MVCNGVFAASINNTVITQIDCFPYYLRAIIRPAVGHQITVELEAAP
jgi:hypothetical protein